MMLSKIKEKFNFDYFSMWREIPILFIVELFKRKKAKVKNSRILIVNPCLIGEFVASIPAIHDFIRRHPDKKIDLLVTSNSKELAEKMVGVHKIFITKSVYVGRNKSLVDSENQEFGIYEKIFFLRISESAYSLTFDIKGSEIETAFSKMFFYVLHLIKSLVIGRRPRSWQSLNFDILGGKDRRSTFEEIFNFNNDDYKKIEAQGILKKETKKIIIHVGTKWSMKRWNKDKWVELLKKINQIDNFVFIFIGSEDDLEDYDYISSNLGFKIESLIRKISLAELLLVLKQADYFIGIDSGPSNMAHLVNLRSLTLYGPGPHMYMSDQPGDIVFDKTNGRGLLQMFFMVKNSYINKITVDEVYNSFNDLYQNDKKLK